MSANTTKKTDPLDGDVDFKRFGPIRRAAFAGAGEPSGPSLASLWEMPQLTNDALMLRRGHPGTGKKRSTVVRSVRFPKLLWNQLEAQAHKKRLNLHQVMRAALLGWLKSEQVKQESRRESRAPQKGASRRRGSRSP